MRARDHAPWRASAKGTAWTLRHSRGYTALEALALALWIHDAEAACGICGVPAAVAFELWRRGGPFARGPASHNRRLTVDRIDPYGRHTLENTRIACWPCNVSRGQGIASDATIATRMRRWWIENTPGDLHYWATRGEAPAVARELEGVDLSDVF